VQQFVGAGVAAQRDLAAGTPLGGPRSTGSVPHSRTAAPSVSDDSAVVAQAEARANLVEWPLR